MRILRELLVRAAGGVVVVVEEEAPAVRRTSQSILQEKASEWFLRCPRKKW
jgi:hypothetical protein